MRLGIATCLEKPEIQPADLLAAGEAARLLNAELIPVPWDAPTQPEYDALVLRSTWGYYHDLPKFERWLRSLEKPTLNSPELALWNVNKIYLKYLEKKGVPIVPSRFFRSPAELLDLPWPEVVLKPTISASSHLTIRTTAKEAPRTAPQILAHSAGLAQPYLAQIETAGELSAIYHKARHQPPKLSHAVRKIPRPRDFRVQSEFGGKTHPHLPTEAEIAFCTHALSKIPGEWLYARVDFVNSPEGSLLAELELVEPYLFYEFPGADLEGFATALASHLDSR